MANANLNKVLLIDDSAEYRKLLLRFFKKAYPRAEIVELDPEAEQPSDSFAWSDYDLLILDYDLGKGGNGLEWLRKYKISDLFPTTIMLTVHDDEEIVVKAIRFGAQGFLRKSGLTVTLLIESIENAFYKHNEEKKQSISGKFHVHVFNKEKFFESLAEIKTSDCVMLVEIDKFQELQKKIGIFESDNFVNFITESISWFIMDRSFEASMTRVGDSVIALLVHNIPGNGKIRELAAGLCHYFDERVYTYRDKPVDFSLNIGITEVNEDNIDLNTLLDKVENACYEARATAGNSCSINNYKDDTRHIVEQKINREILSAMEKENIQLLFQSLINVSGTDNPKYTDLYQVRSHLVGDNNRIINAKKFIPVLKKHDLLKRYDRWIIRYCINALSQKPPDDEKVGIFIPITEYSFTDPKLIDWIDKALTHAGSPELGNSLIFEFNAGEFLEKARATKLQINKLRIRAGASIALSGFDDPALLDQCLAKEKFDYAIFSPEYPGDKTMDQNAMQEITSRCQHHSVLSIASKISSGEYLALAATAGIDYVHGHFVQPPMENIIATEKVEM